MKKQCKFASDNDGGVLECRVWRDTSCAEQKFDHNPDGSVNIVECVYGRVYCKDCTYRSEDYCKKKDICVYEGDWCEEGEI